MKVPSSGPMTRERDELLAHYRKQLARFQAVPTHRREAECADLGEETCRALIDELERKSSRRFPR